MKNKIKNTAGKLIAAIILFFSSANMQAAIAAADTIKSLPEVFIKYEGTFDGKPVFSVQFKNQTGNPLLISITDEDGYVFYDERSGKADYTKKFALDADVISVKLAVTITDVKAGLQKTYTITSKQETIQNFSISKL